MRLTFGARVCKMHSMDKLIELLATVGTILGLYLLSEGNISGFTIGMLSNILWLYIGHEKDMYGLMLTNAILIFINLNGLGIV